jgi:hypothetical protein
MAKTHPFTKTRWHQLFASILQEWLTPVGITVQTEIPVSSEPPKADIVLLTKTAKKTKAQYMRLADGLRESKATHLLLEFKYSESFNQDALHQTLAYQYFYKAGQKLKGNQLDCFILSSKTPQKKVLKKLGYAPTPTKGVYKSHFPLFSNVTLLVLNNLSNESHNIPLKLFASQRKERIRTFHEIETQPLSGITEDLKLLFTTLLAIFVNREENDMYADVKELTPEFLAGEGRKWAEYLLKSMPELVSALPAKERLQGLDVKERLQGLDTDDLINGLSPDILNSLKNKIKDLS